MAEARMRGEVEPIDPDIDLRVPARRRELARSHGAVLMVIAVGGGLGATARYGLGELWPTPPGAFPWATFTVNLLGCLLIGVLMVLISEVWAAHRLVRPFLGVGVLGGFTTFSTYAVETRDLLRPGTIGLAFAYLAGTLLAAMLAVIAGVWLTRAATGTARDPDRRR
jgi:fluoride exporter